IRPAVDDNGGMGVLVHVDTDIGGFAFFVDKHHAPLSYPRFTCRQPQLMNVSLTARKGATAYPCGTGSSVRAKALTYPAYSVSGMRQCFCIWLGLQRDKPLKLTPASSSTPSSSPWAVRLHR